ncbi:MAG: hypothetical protein R3F49_16610 [Planctomycetota bacterium]
MLLRCPSCDAELRVVPARALVGVECRRCGAQLTSSEIGDAVAAAKGSRRHSLLILVTALFGAGALLQVISAIGQIGGGRLPIVTTAPVLALVSLAVGAGCVLAMVGLWLLRPWGWWTGVIAMSLSVFLNLKLLTPLLLALNWDHPRVTEVLSTLLLYFGLPIVVGVALLVLLALPSVRLAVGVKDRPIPTRRRIVRSTRNRS